MIIKVFNRIFIVLVALFVLFGFIFPYLLSVASNISVAIAISMILGILYFGGRSILKLFEGKNK